MGHVFHQLYYHFAWATHGREPHLHPSYRPAFLRILNEEVKNRGGWPIRHNAMFDHVHLLVRLPPTVTVSEFIVTTSLMEAEAEAPTSRAIGSARSSW